MGKNSNPADAHRKAQRARELKKNKEARKNVRESKAVKSDTRQLENEIRDLKSRKLDDDGKARLDKLSAELAYVQKLKEKYVAEHPEAKDRVFRTGAHRERRPHDGDGGDDEDGEGGPRDDGVWNRDGTLKDPTRSFYYDPVYNPHGVPPPGMPYRERSVEEEEDDSDDDDIVMPEGPPPGGSDSDSDDSDDIPLPDGPPPPRPDTASPLPPMPAAPFGQMPFAPFPQPGVPFMRPPLHFTGPPGSFRPPMPMHYAGPPQPQHQQRPPRGPHARGAVPSTIQDPLSDKPTTTFQGHRALPPRPPGPATGVDAGPSAASASSSGTAGGSLPAKPAPDVEAATISAEPVLRDLRKEATVFVPRAAKRKAPVPGAAVIGRINAAPGVEDDEGDRQVRRAPASPGLLDKLSGVLKREHDEVDDYQQFLQGLGDLQ